MSKMIVYGEEARKKLQSGIDQLANTVKVTHGFTRIFSDFLFIPDISSFFLLFLYFADFRPVGLG